MQDLTAYSEEFTSGMRVLQLIDRRTKEKNRVRAVAITHNTKKWTETMNLWSKICDEMPGIRIYSSVDERCPDKCKVELQIKLITSDKKIDEFLVASACMQMETRKTNRLHFDMDEGEDYNGQNELNEILEKFYANANIIGLQKSPKGYHLVTERFDWRETGLQPKKNSFSYIYGQ